MKVEQYNGMIINNGIIMIKRIDNKGASTYGLFKCHCGKEFECRFYYVTSGRQLSCGCKKGTPTGKTKAQKYADYYSKYQ